MGSTPPPGPLRRRNGRRQACEPCRKRKVACDHTLPICGRCKKRNTPQNCVYIIANPFPRSEFRSWRDDSMSSNVDAASPLRSETRPRRSENSVSASVPTPGYLGQTSFSVVYQETENSLTLARGAVDATSHVQGQVFEPQGRHLSPVEDLDEHGPAIALSEKYLEQCVTALRGIPNPELSEALFAKLKKPNDGWMRLAAYRTMQSVYETFGSYLLNTYVRGRNQQKPLEDMVQLLCRNTTRPFPEDEEDPKVWLGNFSGRNLRWDALGILFTYWACAAGAEMVRRPDLNSGGSDAGNGMASGSSPPMTFYHACAKLCIDISHEVCQVKPNTLLLYLTHQHSIIETFETGDASHSSWRYHAESIALMTFLGLHQLPDDPPGVLPTAASESKRRLASKIFIIDKLTACFTGRPPLLSRRYVSTSLPLDLEDEVLLDGNQAVEKAVKSLDGGGWNTDGKLYSSTSPRARYLFCCTLDHIMEISLGQVETSVSTILELKRKSIETYSSLPPVLVYDPAELKEPKGFDAPLMYTKLVIRVEHLENLFLVNRLLLQRGHHAAHSSLLSVSLEMVSVTLTFWTHMDRWIGIHADFEWLVMAYAAPAGGILCQELLNPSPPGNRPPEVSRSTIIQTLSLLVGFLGWVSPSAPGGDLCGTCKAIIQRVLDHTLNSETGNTAPTVASTHEVGLLDWDFSDIEFGNYHQFDLLDTFDWIRADPMGS